MSTELGFSLWQKDSDALMTLVDSLTHEEISADASIYAYQGFDPLKIAYELSKRQKNADARRSDIYRMIILFLTRGNKFAKILNKSSEEAKVILNQLFSTYQFVKTKPTKNTDITLARVTATYPKIALMVMEKLQPARPGDTWFASRNLRDIPSIYRTPGVFALVSNQLKNIGANLKLIKAILICQHAEAEVINGDREDYKRQSVEDKLKNIISYARAAHNNPLIKEEERLVIAVKFIVSINNSLSEEFNRVYGSNNDEVITSTFLRS